MPQIVPLRILELLERRLVRDAEVVHEDVHAPELLYGLANDALGLARLGEIGADRTCRTGILARRSQTVVLPSDDDDLSTLVRELTCRRESDTAGRARDDANLVCEAQIHEATTLASG